MKRTSTEFRPPRGLESKDPSIRAEALISIGEQYKDHDFGDELDNFPDKAVGTVADFAIDEEPQVRFAALVAFDYFNRAAGALMTSSALAALIGLRDSCPKVRRQALRVLAGYRHPVFHREIARLRRDKDPDIRASARHMCLTLRVLERHDRRESLRKRNAPAEQHGEEVIQIRVIRLSRQTRLARSSKRDSSNTPTRLHRD